MFDKYAGRVESQAQQRRRMPFVLAWSFALATFALYVISHLLQLWTEWNVYAAEQADHGETGVFWSTEFWNQFGQSTFENWQSEFLQIFWTATGLAFFYAFGSSESKDSDERMEAKLDELLKRLDGK